MSFFTTRHYATPVYAVALCLSIRLSQAGIVPEWLKVERRIIKAMLYDTRGTLAF